MVAQETFIGFGTLVNVIAILVGSALGMLMGERLPKRTTDVITDLLGLITLFLAATSLRPMLGSAMTQATGSLATITIILTMLIATVIGSGLNIEDRVEHLAARLRNRFAGKTDSAGVENAANRRFVDGFVTSCLLFCIGPMTVLGTLSDGLGRGPQTLLLKSMMDMFSALAFASTLGVGVMASAGAVLVIQSLLTGLGWALGDFLTPAEVDALTVAGGFMLLALGLRIIGVKRIRVADLSPALVLAPVGVWLVTLFT